MTRIRTACCLAACILVAAGCRPDTGADDPNPVVVYCSVDEAFARKVLDDYTARTGRPTRAIFDSEAGKTTGLVNRITAEHNAGRPRADLFWSSEIFNTIRLAQQGILDPYASPAAADIPDRFKDGDALWTATAVRARVITFKPLDKPAVRPVPETWEQLANPPYVNAFALANPLFGTTKGHVACMFHLWGPQRATKYLQDLVAGGGLVLDSNGATVRAVIAGNAVYAATDTDDVYVARKAGHQLEMVYPDFGQGGTLLIPCTVALIRGGPNPQDARKLYDFLASAEVEEMLFRSDSGNIPVREKLRARLGAEWPPESPVDYEAVAAQLEQAERAVREILIR